MRHLQVLPQTFYFEFLLVDANLERLYFIFKALVGLQNRQHPLALSLCLLQVLLQLFDLILSLDEALLISCEAISVIFDLLTVLTKKLDFLKLVFLSL